MKILLFNFFLLAFTLNVSSQSKNYFVSPEGDDSNSGLSIETAWTTIDRVNRTTFLPGDNLLFKSGAVWKGQLRPNGSGQAGNPITIDKYGGEKRPIINHGDAEGAAIRLVNQSGWVIQNIEVTSGALPILGIGRQGIVAVVEGEQKEINHIVVRNCYIHDVWGQLDGDTEFTGYNSAAIFVGRVSSKKTEGRANDVLIEGNKIERVDKCGIIIRNGVNDIVVRRNFMENLGGDGIFVSGSYKGLIEYNVAKRTCMRSGDPDLVGAEDFWPHTAAIWIARSNETVIQFNEVYDTGRQKGNGDGFAYDFDFDAKNCILQFNYSRNNHGFLLIMNKTSENIARYNISENDKTHLIQIFGNIEDQNLIHNNIFYVDYGTSNIDYHMGGEEIEDKSRLGAIFKNNIFYANGQGRFNTVYSYGSALDRRFVENVKESSTSGEMFFNNWYYGPWKYEMPNDADGHEGDPLFVKPGSGGIGLSTLGGYKLQLESSAINSGIEIKDNAEYDFYGNTINDGAIDIGVYEQIGSGAFEQKTANTLNR